jgi:CheY-like chemotaxis protein
MESIGLLAGGVAHDLNNILGPVAAYPDLLLESLSDHHDLVPIIKDIRSSAHQAVAIIRDLLTMARQGRQDATPVSINDGIQEYIQSSTYKELLASHPTVQMEIQLEPHLPLVLGLHVNLNKVLMNLTFNACESMPDGGKGRIETYTCEIKTPLMGYERIPPDKYVALKISDEGIGIPDADQERMFEPFFSKKGLAQSGSGLGLAVVYGVVKDLRGYIDVKSILDQGTVITVYLPVTKEGSDSSRAEQKIELGGKESLLVVDDLPQQRDLATKLLGHMGYQVDAAVHGHDAVERIRAHHAKHNGSSQAYDLILLDMIVEDNFDGLDTFKEILKIYPEQKCIIVSGYAETTRVRQAQSLGALQYVPKPYTREELGLAVRNALAAT